MSNKKVNKSNVAPSLASLGHAVKAERGRQGLSLDALAGMCGVSKGMLSQIEQGKTNPTVAVLYRIASGLHVAPTHLLPAPDNEPRVWQVVRADDERTIFADTDDCRIRTLSPLDLDKQIEFYEVHFAPDGKLVSEPHYQGTDELLTVSKGRLRVVAGGKETILKSGDSVQYAADIPHAIWNLSKSTTKAYLIVWYRT